MSIFQIDSKIRRDKTLSSAFYLEDEYFERSKEAIFARTWQLVDPGNQTEKISPKVLLEGFIDEPIFLTNSSENKRRCFSNVCTHRGKILVEESSNEKGIRCSYHGRCFSLDGKFLSMPEFEEAENFPSQEDDLHEIRLEGWERFSFVSLNPLLPIESFLREMVKQTRDVDFLRLEKVSQKDYEVKAHWALYCENYLEGLHIPFVHNSLNKEIDNGTYTTELFPYSNLQTGFDEKRNVAARYFFVFPNMMFNFYPWGVSINIVKPITRDSTKVSYFTLVNDESKLEVGAGADLETVELEDQAIVESVQKGIESRFYDRGRYSPTREQGTHHFHRLICEFMSDNH